MKPTTLKISLTMAFLFVMLSNAISQSTLAGVYVDVIGQSTNYDDKLWVITDPSCTRDYNNGWDAYKMSGNTALPCIYAVEPKGNFQIDVIPADNMPTYINFVAGVDSVYTIKFTSQYLSNFYKEYYFVDSIANKTIDIFNSGATYTFTAKNKTAIKRFKIVTSLPQPVIPPVVTNPDTVVVPVIPPVVVNPSIDPTIPPVVTPTTPSTGNKDSKNTKDSKDTKVSKDSKDKNDPKLKIYSIGKQIYVENSGNKGKLIVCNAITGKTVKSAEFNASGTTIIDSNVMSGAYVINGINDVENVAVSVILN